MRNGAFIRNRTYEVDAANSVDILIKLDNTELLRRNVGEV